MKSIDKQSSTIDDKKSFVLLGALVGLAFAVLENLIDYGSLATIDAFERTLVSWPIHMVKVGISAYGFGKYRNTKEIGTLTSFLSLAIVIHFLANLIFSTIQSASC